MIKDEISTKKFEINVVVFFKFYEEKNLFASFIRSIRYSYVTIIVFCKA